MKIHKIFGLDLGTTNSTASAISNNKLFFAKDIDTLTIPSIVAEKNGVIIVGKTARTIYHRNSLDGYKSVKREMGKSNLLSFGTKQMKPEEISSLIVKHCADLLNQQISKPDDVIYDRVIITVPAYFNIAQKDATRKAGELAGLEVVMLLEEPTAAAMNFAISNNIENGLFLVYDLGGGTFDVSIVEKIGNVPVVLSTAGNNYLGGDNFDNILAHYFIDVLKKGGYKVDNIKESITDSKFSQVIFRAEITKKELSQKDSVSITYYDIFGDGSGVELIIDNFTRQQFNKLIYDKIVKDTIFEVDKALSHLKEVHGKTLQDITHIVMVGGSTKIPFVQEIIKEKYCITDNLKDLSIYEPDLSVSAGAAYTASSYNVIIEDEKNKVKLYVNSPYSIDSKIYLTGKVFLGSIDSILMNIDNTEYTVKVNGDSSFSLSFDGTSIDNISYSLIKEGKIISSSMGSFEPIGQMIVPTPIQNENINIEIVNLETQEIQKFPVILTGRPLPCSATHDFKINEYSREKIILPVWEGPRNPFDVIIDVPPKTSLGSRVSVTVSVDELSNIEIDVVLDGVRIQGSYVYKENILADSNVKETVDEQFSKKIENVKSQEEKEVILEKKTSINRELDEAKKSNDESHYNSVVEKYQTLVNDLPNEKEITNQEFDDLAKQIYPKLSTDSKISKEEIDNLVLFGKRAISRGDFVQAKECYTELEDKLHYLTITEDPSSLFSLAFSMALDMVNSAEDTRNNINDSSIKNIFNREIDKANKSINDIFMKYYDGDDLNTDGVSKAKIKEETQNIFSAVRPLVNLVEQYAPKTKEINEKISRFKGRVSKA